MTLRGERMTGTLDFPPSHDLTRGAAGSLGAAIPGMVIGDGGHAGAALILEHGLLDVLYGRKAGEPEVAG